MDAVNELSCEFAASVFTKINVNNQISRQDAANLIRNFHKALYRLQEISEQETLKKLSPNEKTMNANH